MSNDGLLKCMTSPSSSHCCGSQKRENNQVWHSKDTHLHALKLVLVDHCLVSPFSSVNIMGIMDLIAEASRLGLLDDPGYPEGPGYLSNAILSRSVQAVRIAIRNALIDGFDLDSHLRHGATALTLAALESTAEVCEVLINSGASVAVHSPDEDTPMLAAVGNHDPRVFALLLKYGGMGICFIESTGVTLKVFIVSQETPSRLWRSKTAKTMRVRLETKPF